MSERMMTLKSLSIWFSQIIIVGGNLKDYRLFHLEDEEEPPN